MAERSAHSIKPAGDLGVNTDSFRRHLRAENLSPRTQETYTEAILQFHSFLSVNGMPLRVAHIRRDGYSVAISRWHMR